MAKVRVELGQRAWVNGAYHEAGESVYVPEDQADAFAYKPKAEKKDDKSADKGEGKKAEK